MTAARIRQAGKVAEVRAMATRGESFKAIADALTSQGIAGVTSTSVRRLLAQETSDRREAASAVAADEATQSTRLAITTLRSLVEQGAALAREAHDTRNPDAWSKTARVAVIACEVLEKITSGTKPAAVPMAIEQLRERVRLVYGMDQPSSDEAANEPPSVH